jgi:hypothetical protein
MSYSISTLLTRNLHDVFGEKDPGRNPFHPSQLPRNTPSAHNRYLVGEIRAGRCPDGRRSAPSSRSREYPACASTSCGEIRLFSR